MHRKWSGSLWLFLKVLYIYIDSHSFVCRIRFFIIAELSYVSFTDLKLGISEKSIFHEFHPDAEDLFNVTCDLKLVCEKLRDRTQRHKRQVCYKISSNFFILFYVIATSDYSVIQDYK